MQDIVRSSLLHAKDSDKDWIIDFWMPGNVIDASREMQVREKLASFCSENLECVINGAGENRLHRGRLVRELQNHEKSLSRDGMRQVTTPHVDDAAKNTIVDFWMPNLQSCAERETALRRALNDLSSERLETILNGHHEDVRQQLAETILAMKQESKE